MNGLNRLKHTVEDQGTGQIPRMAESFERSFLASNRAQSTVTAYTRPVLSFAAFLKEMGMPQSLSAVKREHVESYIADLREREGICNGKGNRPRGCPFCRKSGQALDRYLRAREEYPNAAHGDALWLGTMGKMGKMGPWGVGQVVERRAREARLQGVHVHHVPAHVRPPVAGGGRPGGRSHEVGRVAMRITLSRDGASAADERATEAHKRLSPGDKIQGLEAPRRECNSSNL